MNAFVPAATADRAASIERIETLETLAGDLAGSLSLPGDDDWNVARLAWNLAVDQKPAAVVIADNAQDVVKTVRVAAQLGLRVAPQSTGHNANPLGDLTGTILMRTSDMRGVTINARARRARVEAGALWMDVTRPAARFGLAALAGSSPDVGVAGYLLGGGLSWLARSHGVAANHVTALEIVTADGRLRRIDADHEPELFWAVRGGSGNFGIVTAIEMALHPITHVYSGTLFFPFEDASIVLQSWREWVKDVPESVTSVGRILQFPPIPDLPDFLSGKSFVVVEAAMQLDPSEADELLAPLRDLHPVMDTFHVTPVEELDQLHMDPPQPVPGYGDGFLLSSMSAEAIDAFVAAAGPDSDSAMLSAEIRHIGGAAARAPQGAGVVSHFDSDFAVFAVGLPVNAGVAIALKTSIAKLQMNLAPWTAPRLYQNFAEVPKDARAIWGSDVDRLRAIKVVYDPNNLFRSNHPVL